jgi:hypothetical protein
MISTMLDHLPSSYSYGRFVGEGQAAKKSYKQTEAARLHLHSESRSFQTDQRFKTDGDST